jgi:TolA-binding protein
MSEPRQGSRGRPFVLLPMVLILQVVLLLVIPARAADSSEDAKALYERGVAEREQGFHELVGADTATREERRARAVRHFEQAARHFDAAARAFAARPGNLPLDLEWSACARCARGEMELHAGKLKDARAAVAPLLTDPLLTHSRYRDLALYESGLAAFLQGDLPAAGRALNLITDFTDPQFGTHPRYLLGRVHEAAGERREAVLHYRGVVDGHEDLKKKAAEQLAQAGPVPTANEKARWQALLDGPPPAHVAAANLRLGLLLYGDGRFDEARSCFADFLAQQPPAPLRSRAQLGLGASLVQLAQFAEAVPVLRAVARRKSPPTGDALLWLGRAQLGLARPDDPDTYPQALQDALTSFRQAAGLPAGAGPQAKVRRGTALLEYADTLQLVGQEREAAGIYAQLARERMLPGRDEELLQRQLTALHRAGDYDKSDALCLQFLREHPRSVLAPEVLFRHAENAHFLLLAAEGDPRRPDRVREIDRLNEETARRCRALIDRFPEFEHVPRTRHALALTYHRRGAFDKAQEILESIPPQDRQGDLAVVSYLLADCLLRQLPDRADDAVAAGRLVEQLKAAAEALTACVEEPSEPPFVPDALMRLGYCQRRLAALAGQEEEQKQWRERSRAAFEQVLLDHPGHDLQAHALLERARCMAESEDPRQAMARLRRFTAGPLGRSPIAPLALLQLGTLLRGEEGKAAEAARLLQQCLRTHEASLRRDPARRGWVPLLQYQQALALKEAGKPAAARAILGRLREELPEGVLAAAVSLRWGQCLADEGRQAIEQAEQLLGAPDPTPEETARAEKDRESGRQMVRAAPAHFEKEAERWRPETAGEVRALFFYEAAWGYRRIAEQEVEAERARLQEAAPGERPEAVLGRVALRPAEKKARALYQRLIDTYPDLDLTHHARLELGELYASRGEPAAAVKVFNEAIDKEPPAELADRVRLRLGASHQARGDSRAALRQYEVLAHNPDSAQAGAAHLLAGECFLQAADWTKAVEHFRVFEDQEKFQEQGTVTERGLLLLGHALGRLGQWEASRKAYEALAAKFPESPWLNDTRYGSAWTWLRQKDPARAVKVLSGIAADITTQAGARGQLLLAVCRMEQKQEADAVQTLLAVAEGQAPDEVKALALAEAAHATARLGQDAEAEKLWQRLIREQPKSPWAAVARERRKAGAKEVPHRLAEGMRQLAPVLPPPFQIEMMGDQQSPPTPVDDPTGEASAAVLLQRPLPQRNTPAPVVRLAVADPFEHREAVRHLVPAEEEPLPVRFSPRPPR